MEIAAFSIFQAVVTVLFEECILKMFFQQASFSFFIYSIIRADNQSFSCQWQRQPATR